MARTLFALFALALFGTARAADPDPRSPLDVFGKPCPHGPLVSKAFIGLYSGRTDLFFGQPLAVELFAVPAGQDGPFVNPSLPDVKFKFADEKGNAVPFELDDRGAGDEGPTEYRHFRVRPTKAHSVGGFWKPGTYTLSATVVNPPAPPDPRTVAGTFTSNELKFVVRAADAPREELDPKRKLAYEHERPTLGPSARFWLHAAGLSATAQVAERERLKFGAEQWGVHTAAYGPILVPQDRKLTDAEERQLIADLRDKRADVRARAANGVPRGASKEVLAALLPRLGDEYEEAGGPFHSGPSYPVRGIAHETLARFGADVVPALVTAARGELYAEHREDIVRTLGRIGHHPDAEKWLAELIAGDAEHLQRVAQSVAVKWGAAGTELSRRTVARAALAPRLRADAIGVLASHGTLKDDAPRLRPLLESEEGEVQDMAAYALMHLKDVDSLPTFEKIARSEKANPGARYWATDAVLNFAPKETGDKLLLALLARPDDRNLWLALRRAGERKLEAAVPLVLAALDDKDWYNRLTADRALRGLANHPAGVGYDPEKPDAKAWRAFWAKRDKK